MQPALWFFLGIVMYIGGLVIIWKITPRLFALPFDEGLFMAFAALDILGGLLTFGGVVATLSPFGNVLGIKIIDLGLLLGLFWLALRLALRGFRGRANVLQPGRILAGVYCLFLSGAAVFAIVQLFH